MSEAASGMLTLGGWWRLNDAQRIEHKLKKKLAWKTFAGS